jgi:hypothetical protein
MDSSVQDNPAAPSPCQYTLKALLNSVLGWYSNTNFTQHFLNRLVSSRAVSTFTDRMGPTSNGNNIETKSEQSFDLT